MGRRDAATLILDALARPAGGLALHEQDRMRVAFNRSLAAASERARSLSVDELVAAPDFVRLLADRLESRETLDGVAQQLHCLLEFALLSGSDGVSFYFSHAEPASAQAALEAMRALGWSDDAEAFAGILALVGDALGDDAAEERLRGFFARRNFEALACRLRFTDLTATPEVEDALRAFVRAHADAFV
ncbi:MAG: hypothetical protein ACK4N5_23310 [Myxococcales bacterium]